LINDRFGHVIVSFHLILSLIRIFFVSFGQTISHSANILNKTQIMPSTYQLVITLKDVKPTVWRRINVDSDMKLSDFHYVLQTTMGWTNSHLHQFVKDGLNYTEKMPDNDSWEDGVDVDYKKFRIADLLKKEKDHIEYIYDFGDYWRHDIELVSLFSQEVALKKPACLDGARHCPNEDSGGAHGYNDLQRILKNTKHPEYEEYLTWAGKDFDPDWFDAAQVSEELKNKRFGVKTWEEGLRINPFGKGDEKIEHCEGFSAVEMNALVMTPFENPSPLKMIPVSKDDLKNVPILNLSLFLLDIIERENTLKLTTSGRLPIKVVNEMYHTGFVKNRYMEIRQNRVKNLREEDDLSFELTRTLLVASGVIKKINNKLSLTKKGEKLKKNNELLFRHLLSFYGLKYDWFMHDALGFNEIGNYGFAYSLVLLGMYGQEKRLDNFYAEKYFKAFPWLMDCTNFSRYMSQKEYSYFCYSFRSVNVFMNIFGLAHVEEVHQTTPVFTSETYLCKTELFEKLFIIMKNRSLK
jgi:Plasmid pRiA4b ORF-3-like protein